MEYNYACLIMSIRCLTGQYSKTKLRFQKHDMRHMEVLSKQSQDRVLSEEQQKNAFDVLKNYQREIKGLGIQSFPSTFSVYTGKFLDQEMMVDIIKKAKKNTNHNNSRVNSVDTNIKIWSDESICIKLGSINQSVIGKIKNISGRSYESERQLWVVPFSALDTVKQLFPDAEYDNSIQIALNKRKKLIQLSNAEHSDFEVTGLGGSLRPYQKAGVEFMHLSNGKMIDGDDMGLGKTIQAAAYLQLENKKRPVIITCPSTLKLNWVKEIEKWVTTNNRCMILSGKKPYPLDVFLSEYDVFIINYDVLYEWREEISKINPQVLIFDEAHRLMNAKPFFTYNKKKGEYEENKNGSKRGKAAWFLTELKSVEGCLFLTGTPLQNKPIEFWPLLAMLNPEWKDWYQYAQRYCALKRTRFGLDYSGSSNREELNKRIKPYFKRRLKSQVLKELPVKQRSRITIDLSKSVRKEYNQILNNLDQWIRENTEGTEEEVLERIRRVNKAERLVKLGLLRQCASKGKIKFIKEWIKDFETSGKSLVVFGIHKYLISELMEEFGDRAVKIDGSVTGKKRQEAVDQFQSGKVNLLFGNIDAAGEGITLTSASDMLMTELPWKPPQLEQAEDRIYRIGQENHCNIHYLVASDTVEEDFLNLLDRKLDIFKNIVDGDFSETNRYSELDEKMIVDELFDMTIRKVKMI